MNHRPLLVLSIGILLAGCGQKPPFEAEAGANAEGHTAPTQTTAERNAAVLEQLPFSDTTDFDDARRGLIATVDPLVVRREDGKVIWDQSQYAFEDADAPASANPSLWRQAQLNAIHGLFQVTERVYQLRGFDLANMSLIRGDTGWIIVDPLTTRETSATAWEFARKQLDDLPIRAILFTHSHVDHFGGVMGLISAEQIKAEGIRVIAPAGFMEEATSENVMAGVAMQRRAAYQYGRRLARDERGHIDLGLGKEVPFGGQIGIVEPNELIDHTPQKLTIDGLDFVFQYTPGSEAPAEYTFYIPSLKAFCGAEVVSHNLHNIYTLRGAKVRDALRWSDYIQEITQLFGDADVYFGSHHWPIWGNERVMSFLGKQRDIYKYIHDQTVRMANLGYTPREIAEELELPASLRTAFADRGYYGTVKHNAKAVYQFYFGWYDANPANLDPLPPAAAGKKYVAAMGGADTVINLAQAAFDEGEYRWTAQLLNHLVFAEPDNTAARALLAKTYDQLGYQAESGPWRDVYLTGAYELRHGNPDEGVEMATAIDLLRAIPLHKFFESMAARLNGPKAEGKQMSVNFIFPDRGEGYHLWLENAVLHSEPYTDQMADATLKLTHELFLRMAIGQAGIKETLFGDELEVEGSKIDMVRFMSLFDKPDGRFAIVTP